MMAEIVYCGRRFPAKMEGVPYYRIHLHFLFIIFLAIFSRALRVPLLVLLCGHTDGCLLDSPLLVLLCGHIDGCLLDSPLLLLLC